MPLPSQTRVAICEAASPLVSVLLPTFNRPDYLRATLQSALHQSWRDLEIIVQDNASAVNPAAIVASFADPRLRYFRNAANLGVTANVVSAAARARGKYVAILGDDDLWRPDFLRALVAPLEADPSLALAFCDHDIIDPAGRVDAETTEKVTRRWQRHRLREGIHQPFDEIALVYRAICVFSAALLRRDAIEWAAIPLDMHLGTDLYIAYLAARTGRGCYYVPRRLAQYRYHGGSLGSSLRRADQRLANARDAMLYWDRFKRDRAVPRNRRYFEMKLGLNALVIVASLLRCGEWRQALRHLRRYWHAGLIHPRIFLYHVVYALRLHRANA